jgi:hypothetical protein
MWRVCQLWLCLRCDGEDKNASFLKFLEKENTSEGKGSSSFFLEGCGGRRRQGPSVACGRASKRRVFVKIVWLMTHKLWICDDSRSGDHGRESYFFQILRRRGAAA